MRVAIAGAGIGGLATALALARTGHEVVVCERSDAQGEVGAGIQISPNAVRALEALGVRSGFDRIAVHPERIVVRRWADDAVLRSMPLDGAFVDRFGERYANVHRGELAQVLADALRDHHPDVRVVRGVQVVGVSTDDTGESAALQLGDGSTVEADVVVGADGIRSAVRTSLFGATPSRFSGGVAYRALIPTDRLPGHPVEVSNRLGPDSHVVTYFVGAGARWLNLVCIVPEPLWDVESWTEPGSVDDLRRSFDGWSEPLRRVLALVDEPVFRWALHDRPPLERWGAGAVTLLGDACHPMLPFLAQGACQALEDAVVLARQLAVVDPSAGAAARCAALRRYEEIRRPRTDKVQRASWRNREVYHLPDGEEQRRRDAGYAAAGDDPSAFDWLYGHHVSARD